MEEAGVAVERGAAVEGVITIRGVFPLTLLVEMSLGDPYPGVL